jgi:hypothetical protein
MGNKTSSAVWSASINCYRLPTNSKDLSDNLKQLLPHEATNEQRNNPQSLHSLHQLAKSSENRSNKMSLQNNVLPFW